MSATTRDQELYDIITRFKIFNPSGLVFSKLDESATFGDSIDLLDEMSICNIPQGHYAEVDITKVEEEVIRSFQ